MLIRQVIEVFDLLDSAYASGDLVRQYLESRGDAAVSVKTIRDGSYATDFLKVIIHGRRGKTA